MDKTKEKDKKITAEEENKLYETEKEVSIDDLDAPEDPDELFSALCVRARF